MTHNNPYDPPTAELTGQPELQDAIRSRWRIALTFLLSVAGASIALFPTGGFLWLASEISQGTPRQNINIMIVAPSGKPSAIMVMGGCLLLASARNLWKCRWKSAGLFLILGLGTLALLWVFPL